MRMNTITIDKVSLADINQMQSIGRETFIETFAEHNTAEDMQTYMDTSFTTTKLTEELNDPNSAFYFAVFDTKVIGYLKLNFGKSQTELKDENSIEIERIYVLKAFHGKKAGQLLYEKALQIARLAQVDYIWLGVWEKNQRAIQFYKKNGFVEFDKHIFTLGSDKQTDIMMRLKLI